MVVDEAHRLHERVERGGADEGPAPGLQVAAEGHRLGGRREALEGVPRQTSRTRSGLGTEAREVGGERSELALQLDRPGRVVDGRFDLAPMPDDSGVLEQAIDVAGTEPGHRVEVEAAKGAAEGLALAEDDEPAQPGLESFEADLLEEPAPIADGQSPFAVVVAAVERIAVAPEAADDAVVAAHDASRKPAHGRRLTRWPDEVRPIAV